MSLLEMLMAKPVLQALGWALVHFIWQGALVAILYAGVAQTLRRRAANARYSLACAAMLLMLALPVATVFITDQSSARALKDQPIKAVAISSETSPMSRSETLSQGKGVADSEALSFRLWAQE